MQSQINNGNWSPLQTSDGTVVSENTSTDAIGQVTTILLGSQLTRFERMHRKRSRSSLLHYLHFLGQVDVSVVKTLLSRSNHLPVSVMNPTRSQSLTNLIHRLT